MKVGKLKKALFGTAIALALLSHNARAESGFELLSQCRSNAPDDTISCMEYLRGVWDGLVWDEALHKSAFLVCPENDRTVTNLDMRKAYVSWATLPQNSKVLSEPSGVGVFRALMQTWPCSNS